MVLTQARPTVGRTRTGPIRRGPTRVLRNGRTREAWRYAIPDVYVPTAAEGRAMFDRQARKELGISGEEFLRRWDAGEYREDIEDMDEIHKVNRMVMMMPFAGRTPT